MESKPKISLGKPNPVANANPFSQLTFAYMFKIFAYSYKHGFQEEDLCEALEEHRSNKLGEKLERIWYQERKKHKKAALHIAIFKMFGPYFLLMGFMKCISLVTLVVVNPFAIGKLVLYFQNGENKPTESEAYIYGAVIIAAYLLDTILTHPCLMGIMHTAMKMRVACSAMLYRKSLRLSRTSLGQTTIGQLVNLLSNDVSKFDQGFIMSHFIFTAPIQAIVGIWMLYRVVGVPTFNGIALLVALIPVQFFLGKRTSVLRMRTAIRTDERVRLMNEIVSGIQVIKMYTWEKSFAKLIGFARKRELQTIRQQKCLYGIMCSFGNFVTRTATFATVLGYVLMGNTLTAEKAFSITAIYNLLNTPMTYLFSHSMIALAEVNVSIKRMHAFMNYEEIPDKSYEPMLKLGYKNGKIDGASVKPLNQDISPKVVLSNASAKWSSESSDNTLENINLSVTESLLIAIIGPVGCGKSSLFNLILKELPLLQGSLTATGVISYASQEPWLFNGSVRENILFGEPYDQRRYDEIIRVCALQTDLKLLPFGDRTIIGEKGKSLSGGQKARINLARCVYKNADIYLLDDPLSAVDANVGTQLYEECIQGLLKNKIRILSTHQLQYLKSADRIVVLREGQIQIEGSFEELQSSSLDFVELLKEFNPSEDGDADKQVEKSNDALTTQEAEDSEDGPKIETETLESGRIKFAVYGKYFKAGGNWFMVLLLISSAIIVQGIASGVDYFVSYWVNQEQLSIDTGSDTVDREFMVYVYGGLVLATVIFSLGYAMYFFLFSLRASSKLHILMFRNIVSTNMRFFNKNPSGRILNRFSKDMGTVDEYISNVMYDVMWIGLVLIAAVVLSCIVNIWVIIPSLVLIFIMCIIRLGYLKTSRALKRIEGIKRSPIFSHMSATINGLPTIRASKAEKMLTERFDEYQDGHSSSWFLFIAANRAFGLYLDLLCITFIAIAIFTLLLFGKDIHGGDMGLVVTQFAGLVGILQWGMRQWSELENQMTSVERILEYTELEKEPMNEKHPPPDWPKAGKVEFRHLSMRYNIDEPYVLKDLSIMIHPKEKIGVVGRTGAGKSSLIAALFQLYTVEGSIFVDDVDITQLSLDQVRTKISIIPQEPVLFSGTVRKNLDPFDEYSDDVLWHALDQVELKNVIADLPSGLHTKVSEGGSNYSVGQRQLVCLARAIIRNNRILVMDEATANVDPHTDSLIQTTIRTMFRDCTVITIAHRLHTVMDSDKILVMSEGRVMEFDSPDVLLENKQGFFYHLVQTTGKSTSKPLPENR